MANTTPDDWITSRAASELTGYHIATIRWLIKEGRIRGRKQGRDWFVIKEEVREYKQKMDRLGAQKHDPTRQAQNPENA